MTVLITGHTGMLGRSLVDELSRDPELRIVGVSKTNRLNTAKVVEYNLDLSDLTLVDDLLFNEQPNIIIHTAAYTDLRFCEENIDQANNLHVVLTEKLSSFAGARMIYVSTDSVFDGSTGQYTETATAYPKNFYAFSKLQGEWIALHRNRQCLVARTNIYGFKKPSGNSLAEWAIDNLRRGEKIGGYTNVWFNPLYVRQLSRIIASLIKEKSTGIWHLGSKRAVSKFDFLRLLAGEFGYQPGQIYPSIQEDGSLRRPKNTVLNTAKFRKFAKKEILLEDGIKQLKVDYDNTYSAN